MWAQLKKFRTDQEGATLVYVSVMVTVLFAMIGLALDFSRFYMSDSEAQAAADAAALAAATQLDGGSDSITRATAAAMTTPLVANSDRFTKTGSQDSTVTISNIRFLSHLPPSDDTAIDASFETTDATQAEYVEVTTEVLTHNNFFLPVMGIANSKTLTSTAVAGQESAICRVTPFFVCNPEETATNKGFNPHAWKGRQILVKTDGNNAQWGPGNFGLLDTPEGNQGASALAESMASTEGPNACFSTNLDTKPGQVSSLRSALNTRFDIYEQPFFNNDQDEDIYAPSPNVIKGRIWTGSGANTCGSFDEPGSPIAMGLPRDKNLTGTERIGNGMWDCLDYWNVNHPGLIAPSGCANNSNGISRYDIYRYEIDNNLLPDGTPDASGDPTENGSPVCYKGDTSKITTDESQDRRVLHFALMNCIEHDPTGNTEKPAKAFLRAFLTEPVGDESTPGASDFEVYLEIIEVVEPGGDGGVLREYVEIVR